MRWIVRCWVPSSMHRIHETHYSRRTDAHDRVATVLRNAAFIPRSAVLRWHGTDCVLKLYDGHRRTFTLVMRRISKGV